MVSLAVVNTVVNTIIYVFMRILTMYKILWCLWRGLSDGFRKYFTKLWPMELVRFVCPHCSLRMEAQLEGKPSSMMVFVCARCKSPLMRYAGEVFELDKEEYAGLRKKLSPVIAKLLQEHNAPSISDDVMRELAQDLESCQDVSEFIDKI